MKIVPTAEDWKFASAIYAEFRAKPESQRIATRYALAHLSALLTTTRPGRILEVGAGIGTITKLLLTHPAEPKKVISLEANELCRNHLSRNVPASDRWRLCYEIDEIRAGEAFNLVILDATIDDRHCAFLTSNTICFVEGNRRPFRRIVEEFLAKRGSSIEFTQHSPRWQLRWKPKRILGVLPKLKLQRRKGCFVGRVHT